jgi:hypothetical protein
VVFVEPVAPGGAVAHDQLGQLHGHHFHSLPGRYA